MRLRAKARDRRTSACDVTAAAALLAAAEKRETDAAADTEKARDEVKLAYAELADLKAALRKAEETRMEAEIEPTP
eukprot:5803702-Pleurochrysis_carterae.AAC.3